MSEVKKFPFAEEVALPPEMAGWEEMYPPHRLFSNDREFLPTSLNARKRLEQARHRLGRSAGRAGRHAGRDAKSFAQQDRGGGAGLSRVRRHQPVALPQR